MIKIICVGKIKESYLNDLINDYKTRISKYHKIEIIELKDSNIDTEKNELLKVINTKDYNKCLDNKGTKLNSIELSNMIKDTFTSGYGTISFIIGSSDGISEEVKSICNKRISFSDLTFPHGLFRGLLLEQIYRSFKIMNNESYHK